MAAPVGSRAMQLIPWGCRRLALVWGPMRATGGTCTRVQGKVASACNCRAGLLNVHRRLMHQVQLRV